MTLDVQLITMLSMIIGGFYLGMAHDTYRRFAPYWKEKTFFVYLFEISFWLSQTGILFFLLYKVNAGELRLYIFAACLLGFSIYQVVAANIYKKVLEFVIRIIVAIYRWCRKVIQVLLITPLKWIFHIILTLILFSGQVVIKLLMIVFLPVKWLIQLIYHLLPKKIKKNIPKSEGLYSIIENIYIKLRKFFSFKRR
ncbi:MAG TPA: spore cortex biosynthesis protein YabQ [Virgibacillus sp.]|nr:spore cortex biosynthesis protein YabQ [Virgibacillus sp.]